MLQALIALVAVGASASLWGYAVGMVARDRHWTAHTAASISAVAPIFVAALVGIAMKGLTTSLCIACMAVGPWAARYVSAKVGGYGFNQANEEAFRLTSLNLSGPADKQGR
jgi:hypothetical protein